MWPASRSPAMLFVLLALSILVALVAAIAQPRALLARIAFLGLTPAPSSSALPPNVAAFQQGLRELGWVEGQNLTIEWRW
jgi:putative tryptophan/tyrosine transport system substrate-binding protein